MDPSDPQFQHSEMAPLPPFGTDIPPGTPHFPPGTPIRPGMPAAPYEMAATLPVLAMMMPHLNGKEIRINNPTEFDGNREHLNSFLQDCHLYLTLNEEIYNTDDKRIIFILSYMMKGTAKAWKEAFVQDIIIWKNITFGLYDTFLKKVHKAFAATDVEGDARTTLRQLQQGNRTVDDYIAQFRILAGRARISDNTTLIEYFIEGLNVGILQKIFAQQTIPK